MIIDVRIGLFDKSGDRSQDDMGFDLVKRDPDSFFVIFDQTDFFQCLDVGMNILHVPTQKTGQGPNARRAVLLQNVQEFPPFGGDRF